MVVTPLMFDVAAGKTLIFTGDVVAPAAPLFTGLGRVDLTRSRVIAARPEWWGAVPDDPAVDCGPAFRACLDAHVAMQLGVGDYHLADTWRIDKPNRRIWGIGRSKGFRGSRLVLRQATGPVAIVGTMAAPTTTNAYLWGVDLRWIEFGRSVPPQSAGRGPAELPTGVAIRHVVDCVFEGVRANEHAVGFSIVGAVRTFLRECSAFRSSGSDGLEYFVGFDLDGRVPPVAIGTGANASLYLVDCTASTGGDLRLSLSAGCRLMGAFSDTFIDRFETTNVGVGVLVEGRQAELDPARRRAAHVDLHIRDVVLDQCREAGIRLTGLDDEALVDIGDPYIALAPAGREALDFSDCGGNIGVTGGQLIGWTARGSAVGIMLQNTSGVAISGTKLSGFGRPVDAVASTAFAISIAINHRGPPAGDAIRLAACSHGHVQPRITGTRGAFRCAVAADGACDAVDIATAGIVPTVLAAGEIVRIDGHAVEPSVPGRIYLTAK